MKYLTLLLVITTVNGTADYMVYGQGSDATLSRPYCNG